MIFGFQSAPSSGLNMPCTKTVDSVLPGGKENLRRGFSGLFGRHIEDLYQNCSSFR